MNLNKILDKIDSLPQLKEIYKEVQQNCIRDNCYSSESIFLEFLEKLEYRIDE